MHATPPASPRAQRAHALVTSLQGRLVDRLETAARTLGVDQPFEPVSWLRDDGRHGGGTRRATGDTAAFNRASANVSAVHYDDEPQRSLSSATALSAIVHPDPARAPSMHIHISLTERKDGQRGWRVMGDLNPSHPSEDQASRFRDALRASAPERADEAFAEGDRYFHIPALDRHRGVVHWYQEGLDTGDFDADLAQAEATAKAIIDTYTALLTESFEAYPHSTAEERQAQLRYHTLYFFQVLTLDRGTTSGLLVHANNDVGVLGSLPKAVSRDTLESWTARVRAPQDLLLARLVAALPDEEPAPITDAVKARLAKVVRSHYTAHPEALALQARGSVLPPTVQNHRG